MKSFSATSYPTDQADLLERARMAVGKDPLALFTDFQWWLFRARNTVYFTAFSSESFDREKLCDTVVQMAALAPQLTHGYDGALPGQPFPKKMLEAITSVEEVDDFDGYPDKWLDSGEEVFVHRDLPLFRVRAAVRRGGPDAQGRASMIQVRSSHAVMEGSDSALLTRSAQSAHGTMSGKQGKLSVWTRLRFRLSAWFVAPIHLVSGTLLAPPVAEKGTASIALERHRLRAVCNAIGVGQKALMYALATHAINGGKSGIGKQLIKSIYTTLDTERHELDDDFFRVRTLEAKFPYDSDIVTFARNVHKVIAEIESCDVTANQMFMNSMLRVHRIVSRVAPFLYPDKFFRFSGDYDMALTLIPPHRTYGDLTRSIMEPIYCGTHHPSANVCTFVPARQYVTLNFHVERKHVDATSIIVPLLDELHQKYVG